MSTPDDQPVLAAARAPGLAVRLTLWLGIYLIGGIGFCLFFSELNHAYAWNALLYGVLLYPVYLAFFFGSSGIFPAGSLLYLMAGSFGIYLLHLTLTLRVSRKMTFFVMLAVLVFIIGLTFAGLKIWIASLAD